MMTYKGYQAAVEFDDEAGVFHGVVLHLRDVITFEGTSVDEVRAEFRASVDDYLEDCAERGITPDKPYSGKFMLRMAPEDHRTIATACAQAGQSLNAWCIAKLVECATREGIRHRYLQTEFASSHLVGRGDERISSNVLISLIDIPPIQLVGAALRHTIGRGTGAQLGMTPVNRDAC
jgi:predicted HicB family RNase H-like nuclease